MELHDYIAVLRRRWKIIVAFVLVGLLVAAALSLFVTPRYTATSRLFFGVQSGESVTDLAQGSTFTEKQMASYAEVATSPLVLNQVISKLGLTMDPDNLAQMVSATAPADTVILEIAVTSTNAQQAAQIANSVGDQLTVAAEQLSPKRSDGSESVRATVLAEAVVPLEPSSPVVPRNLALGVVIGFVLGAGAAVARHALDTNIRSEDDISALTSTSVLGVIPLDSGGSPHPVVMHDDALGARSEAIRRLRTNLQFVDVAQRSSSILVTSSIPGEGKSTTAINLAVALSDAGQRVVLVDADLRRPAVAAYLGLEGRVGLTTVLIGQAELEDVLQPWQQTTLDILPSGQMPPNPSELLGSKAMVELVERLTQTYDIVVFDSPPLLPVTDAAVLSKFAGGTLVVVGADQIQKPQLRQALEALSTVGANVVGIVLNKIAKRDASAYVYDAGYRSYGNLPEVDQTVAGEPAADRTEADTSVAGLGVPAADHDSAPVARPSGGIDHELVVPDGMDEPTAANAGKR